MPPSFSLYGSERLEINMNTSCWLISLSVSARSCRPYEEAYHAVSPLLQLPILSDIPTYDPSKPLELDPKLRSPRPVSASTDGKAGETAL